MGNQGSILLSSPSQVASLIAVASAAAFQASGRVAPYELISLYGIGIGPAIAQGGQIVAGYLTTSLGGAQVLFDGVAAPLLYAGANQINAIVPGSVSGRLTTALRVVTPTGSIEGTSMYVTPSHPEVFTTDVSAIALNQDGTINSPTNPAAKSWIVTVWATGGGLADGAQSDGAVVTGTLRKPQLPVFVFINADRGPDAQEALDLLYAGDAPGMVTGVLQINFRLPSQLAAGVKEVICRLQIGTASSATFRIYVAS